LTLSIMRELIYFIERLTFATAEDLLLFLEGSLGKNFLSLPFWVRALSYRLAYLQNSTDAELKRAAAFDLLCFSSEGANEGIRLLLEIGDTDEAEKWRDKFKL
jgi:hypothetical protein